MEKINLFSLKQGIYRIPAENNLDPVKPWKLEVLIESEEIKESKKYLLNYALDSKYIIQPDGISKLADKDEPIWHAAWENQKK